ncbi:hypothetical protein FAZ69_07285 [Trinickia terrae]|uniref:Uncharacterized protein n=1 Tax=Trinickia terrae TaxID=2571161 RepID=A0A4U1IC52_9BURK|nr:hypothetical protein [Trinickia terrae]TKC91158.1 hypothetical protein FAZ69_07285 [Trinickia terrae]
MFPLGSPIDIAFTTRAAKADTVRWRVLDNWNIVRASGQFPVAAGAQTVTLHCASKRAGYFAIDAILATEGGQLPARGTRPAGIATFGVLPDVSAALPPVNFAHQDPHRFGGQGTAYLAPGQHCCDGDGYRPLYPALGLAWANDNRNWYMKEPKGPGTFKPSRDTLAPYFRKGDIMRLIQLDGIPGWSSPDGKDTHSYAPASLTAYQDYMSRVGADSAQIRAAWFPNQSSNYYQVTWEPDYEGGLPWKGSDASFVDMYRATWQGVHASDPNAIVMGTANNSVRTNIEWLDRLAPLGIGRYLDGVAIHGYYDIGVSPSHPPERLANDDDPAKAAAALPASMRELRKRMVKYLKPGAKLFVTETGVSYDIDTSYGPDYPTQNVLFAQGAVLARTHLILLGEGADTTFVFYMADTPDKPPGYGVFFDLADAQGAYGPSLISPKPAAMEIAAMTRIVDGTVTLGAIDGAPGGVYGYAFQRLNGGKIVTALWTHDNARWSAKDGFSASYGVPYRLRVDAPGASGQVAVLDAMGNAWTLPYRDGEVALTLTESPIYVVSANAAAMRANVTAPQGYVAH